MRSQFRPFRRIRITSRSASLALALMVAGCGADTSALADAPAARALPSPADLPSCGSIAAVTGGFLDQWKLEDDNHWGSEAERKYGLSCGWLSPRLLSDNPFEAVKGGSFGITVMVDFDMQSEADARSIGWVVEDPAVEAIGGHLVFPAGRLDFGKQLGIVGPQVVVGKVAVGAVHAGPMALARAEEARSMTNRRAVDTAIEIHKLMR